MTERHPEDPAGEGPDPADDSGAASGFTSTGLSASDSAARPTQPAVGDAANQPAGEGPEPADGRGAASGFDTAAARPTQPALEESGFDPAAARPTQPALEESGFDPAPARPIQPAFEESGFDTAAEGPTRSRSIRVALWLLEVLPVAVVACLIVPWVIAGGTFRPWNPAMTDLEIYRLAAQDMLAGKDFYATRSPIWGLYYIYPPIALILMIPLAFGPYVLWQVLWTVGLAIAQQSVLRRVGVPRGWRLALVGALVVVAVEPIRTSLGYGQVNTFLMAVTVAALLPDPRQTAPTWLRPKGLLIGLATAIKLTPAYFAVIAFFSRRMAVAWWAFAGFVLLTAIGFAAQPGQSLRFWRNDIPAETSGAMYVGNQAISGLVTRWLPMSAWTITGVVIAGIVAIAGVYAARHWWLRGQAGFAIGLAGLVTCLVTPLSWTHHHVWVVPFGAALALGSALPAWVRATGGAWALWIAVQVPLAVLPYRNNAAGTYTFGQDLVANLGPLVGSLFVLALAVAAVRVRRRVPAAEGRGLDLAHGRRIQHS